MWGHLRPILFSGHQNHHLLLVTSCYTEPPPLKEGFLGFWGHSELIKKVSKRIETWPDCWFKLIDHFPTNWAPYAKFLTICDHGLWKNGCRPFCANFRPFLAQNRSFLAKNGSFWPKIGHFGPFFDQKSSKIQVFHSSFVIFHDNLVKNYKRTMKNLIFLLLLIKNGPKWPILGQNDPCSAQNSPFWAKK